MTHTCYKWKYTSGYFSTKVLTHLNAWLIDLFILDMFTVSLLRFHGAELSDSPIKLRLPRHGFLIVIKHHSSPPIASNIDLVDWDNRTAITYSVLFIGARKA